MCAPKSSANRYKNSTYPCDRLNYLFKNLFTWKTNRFIYFTNKIKCETNKPNEYTYYIKYIILSMYAAVIVY